MRKKRHRVVRLDAARRAWQRRRKVAVGTSDLSFRCAKALAHEFGDRRRRDLAWPRSSQVTRSTSAARLARHHESATTATASGIRTMRRTPFIPAIEFSSTDFSSP